MSETKQIDWSRPLQTRNGREVRIYAKDGADDYAIHGAYRDDFGWHHNAWMISGLSCLMGAEDLVNVQRKIEIGCVLVVWQYAIKPEIRYSVYNGRDKAHNLLTASFATILAVIDIKRTVTEGEGL